MDTWYLKYPKLPKRLFVYEISAKYLQEVCPYDIDYESSELKLNVFGKYIKSTLKPIGYCMHPTGNSQWVKMYDCNTVGIMFEDEDGHRVWWHFPYDE